MSTLSELWKNWEGRVADGKFPLRQWLGGSDHGAVFLTDRTGAEPQKAAIKLIPADSREAAQLSRWADAAKLSHPHLIRIFEYGRCQIGDTRLLYVVTEYAEENLAEILPLRPLTPDEASAMLGPTAEALAYLHKSGFVHGHIKPSNIMAVGDQLKISADRLSRPGERGDTRAPSVYDAPEAATAGLSPAADIWSLGATLVAVLTQNEPSLKNLAREPVVVPETTSQAIREIARRCLQVDPQQRYTASDILSRLRPQASRTPVPVTARVAETRQPSPARFQTLDYRAHPCRGPRPWGVGGKQAYVPSAADAGGGSRARPNLQQMFRPSNRQRRLPGRQRPRQRERRQAVCFIRSCPMFRGTRKTRFRDVSKSSSTYLWMRPATSQRQSSFLEGLALTLRIGRWQRRGTGNSTRRKSTDKPPRVSGSCVFSFEKQPSTCFR